jgi:D-glycero-D-manno-heptose 1,7-bisphosphate phosphatase
MSRPAVFLDRDGTIIEERGYLDRLEDVTIFPWTGDALRLLKRAGFATVVITNQSAIARGLIDEAFLNLVHQRIDSRLESPAAASTATTSVRTSRRAKSSGIDRPAAVASLRPG